MESQSNRAAKPRDLVMDVTQGRWPSGCDCVSVPHDANRAEAENFDAISTAAISAMGSWIGVATGFATRSAGLVVASGRSFPT